MRKVAKGILWVSAIALVLWGLVQLIPSEEKRIQKRLQRLAEVVSLDGKEGNIARLARVNSLGGFFTLDTEIQIESPAAGSLVLRGRDEILAVAGQSIGSGRGVSVSFDDIVAKVAPDKQTASADLTAKVTVTGERDFGLQELRFSLKKVEGAWLITRVQSLKTFEQ